MALGTKGWNKLRFFKIVFDEDGRKVMYLPPMIAQKVPHLAGREIEIEDTSRSRWTVTVSQVNGSLAFQRGWQKFFSDHRLKKGEVLVFKYINGSHFVVRIFGLSACDRENFNNEMPRPIKRAKRNPGPAVEEEPSQTHNEMPRPIKRTKKNPGPAVEEEPFQTDNINSRDIPLSGTPVGTSQVPMDMEAMMKKEDWCYQGEDRTIWDDLSKFEPTNNAIILLPSPNESENVSKSDFGFSELAKSIGDDVQMVEGHSDESLTDKLEKPLYTNIAPFHSVIVDKTKKSGDDADVDVIQTNQIEGHSDDIITEKFKKAVETKTVPFHHEITKQAIEIHSSWIDIKHLKKPSESSSSRRGIFDVSSVQNESYSGSPFMGSSKKVYEAKSWSREFPVFSPVGKDPSGKSAIKTEIIQIEEEARRFPQASSGKSATKTETIQIKDEARCFPQASIGKSAIEIEDEASRPPQASSGKEPTMVDNHEPMIVKGEPQFYDEKAAFAPFEAEVKSKLYLELPEEITSFHKKENKRIGKIVYLRDSKQRIWPLFYPNKAGVVALCLNWTNFCHENKIEPGDKCRFEFEKAIPCTLRVQVIKFLTSD